MGKAEPSIEKFRISKSTIFFEKPNIFVSVETKIGDYLQIFSEHEL